jgi:pimeloyl-ACP methyl ester carboxylesterase
MTAAVSWFCRLIKGGVGHNLPQEAPQAFAEAVLEVDSY